MLLLACCRRQSENLEFLNLPLWSIQTLSLPLTGSEIALLPQVPGNIRRAEHFVAFLKRFVHFLKTKMDVNEVTTVSPQGFLGEIAERMNIDSEPCTTPAGTHTDVVVAVPTISVHC